MVSPSFRAFLVLCLHVLLSATANYLFWNSKVQFITHSLFADDIAGHFLNENGLQTDLYLLSQQGAQVNLRFICLYRGKMEAGTPVAATASKAIISHLSDGRESRTNNRKIQETVRPEPQLFRWRCLSHQFVSCPQVWLWVWSRDGPSVCAKQHHYKTCRVEEEEGKEGQCYILPWLQRDPCGQGAFRLPLVSLAWLTRLGEVSGICKN